jgi:lipoate-protein ligase A
MNREAWRRLPFNRAGAGRQLALSESLLKNLTVPTLYWYQAAHPALILGAAQKPEILDMAACRRAGFEIFKRTSGGTLVLAGSDLLSLDIALPPSSRLANSDVTLAYRWFAEGWIAALARLGVAARLVEPEAARTTREALEAAPADTRLVKLICFGTLSSYEVVDQSGRKLVGLAQVKRRSGSLLQAGIHLNWPAADFGRSLALTPPEKEYLTAELQQRAVGLDELMHRCPALAEIVAAFEESLRENWPVELQEGAWSVAELEQAQLLEKEKFTDLSQ